MTRRTLETVLKGAATEYPVVTLTGPRQSGKTTLVRAAFPRHDYASLEDPDVRRFALEDARGFLGQFEGPVVLDEVQRAPELFSYIQTIVDGNEAPGRFVLSGSQNFLLMASVSQSLAGRCAILHLLPFSMAELEARSAISLSEFGRDLPRKKTAPNRDLADFLFTGFYPRIHDKKLDPIRWLAGYYSTYVERDVREITNVGDIEAFSRFVRLCAGRNGQLLNLTSLANDCGITHTTARRWISILETGFLIHLLRPHHRNFGKRLTRSPKLYFLDTGLLGYLLQIRSSADLRHHGYRGSIFESFVLSELLKNHYHQGIEPDLYFWRDSSGHEIDVVIQQGQEMIAVEVKSGQTIARDFFDGLRYWRGLLHDPAAPAALVYGGDRTFKHEEIPVYAWSLL